MWISWDVETKLTHNRPHKQKTIVNSSSTHTDIYKNAYADERRCATSNACVFDCVFNRAWNKNENICSIPAATCQLHGDNVKIDTVRRWEFNLYCIIYYFVARRELAGGARTQESENSRIKKISYIWVCASAIRHFITFGAANSMCDPKMAKTAHGTLPLFLFQMNRLSVQSKARKKKLIATHDQASFRRLVSIWQRQHCCMSATIRVKFVHQRSDRNSLKSNSIIRSEFVANGNDVISLVRRTPRTKNTKSHFVCAMHKYDSNT